MENDIIPKCTHEPNKIAHLQMIQGIIDRMAGNLFYLKGWAITLLAGLFVISTSNDLPLKWWSISLLFTLLLLFWILDGYFLSLESCFRDLYDKVRLMKEEEIDFSMSISEFTRLRTRSPLRMMLSHTLAGFYSILLIAMMLIVKFI